MSASQPCGSSPRSLARIPRRDRETRSCTPPSARSSRFVARAARHRLAKMRERRVGYQERAARPASRGSAWSGALRRRRAASRAPRSCPACSASRSRGACAPGSATGASVSARAARSAASIAARSLPSATVTVCQPYASKRAARSSEKVMSVPAASVTWLSSYRQVSLPSLQMAGERGRLGGDAFHQVAVADDGVGARDR